MISAWKKLVNRSSSIKGNEGTRQIGAMPPGIQKLDKSLQKKFARGVNYNMKVVIKGDKRVGKTSLFLRLKGYGFENDYTPTESLGVTCIDWNYKATDDIIKIDLWEAIDVVTKKNVNFVDLKMKNERGEDNDYDVRNDNDKSNNNNSDNNDKTLKKLGVTITSIQLHACANSINKIPETAKQCLAELSENFYLDVYKNANAVLLVMDMTKNWTFKYIQAELPKIPKHIPILIIANHRDQGHHRSVSAEQVKTFIELQKRCEDDGAIMYVEASMKNGFGMRFIEKFFDIPFLRLQRDTLEKQLVVNEKEFCATLDELQIMETETSREYERYLELETIRRRQQADALSPVNNGLRSLDELKREQIRNSTVSSDTVELDHSNVKSIESSNHLNKKHDPQNLASQNFVNDRLPSIVIGAKCPLPDSNVLRMSRSPISGTNTKNSPDSGKSNEQQQQSTETKELENNSSDDSDDDEQPRTNPLVANYQSDLDSDDQLEKTSSNSSPKITTK